jgi:lysyl-tRNA synthetase class I
MNATCHDPLKISPSQHSGSPHLGNTRLILVLYAVTSTLVTRMIQRKGLDSRHIGVLDTSDGPEYNEDLQVNCEKSQFPLTRSNEPAGEKNEHTPHDNLEHR